MTPLIALLLLAAEPCAPCHSEQIGDFQSHKHSSKGLSCAVCHGAAEKHRNSNGESPPDRVAAPNEVPALCGSCHAGELKDYTASKHGALVLALSKTKAANCNTCHGVHGLKTANQMLVQCNRCHAALPESCKKDPPVAAGIACMGCHARHTLARK